MTAGTSETVQRVVAADARDSGASAGPPELPEDVWRIVAEFLRDESVTPKRSGDLWALLATSKSLRAICLPIAFRRRFVKGERDLDLPDALCEHVKELTLDRNDDVALRVVQRAVRLRALLILRASFDAGLLDLLAAASNSGRVLDVLAIMILPRMQELRRVPVLRVRAVTVLVASVGAIHNILDLLDLSALVRLQAFNPTGWMDSAVPVLPPLPALRALVVRWGSGSPLPTIESCSQSSRLAQLRIMRTPDDHEAMLALLRAVGAGHGQLRELLVMLGSGSDVVPWLCLDQCAAALEPLTQLDRLCLCVTVRAARLTSPATSRTASTRQAAARTPCTFSGGCRPCVRSFSSGSRRTRRGGRTDADRRATRS